MDDKDPPIQAQDFIAGVKVVDFGDMRVARGLSRRPFSSCKHRSLVYDPHERRVWCKDCEKNIDNFDAFKSMVENFHDAYEQVERLREETIAAREHNLHLIAARNLEKLWRGQKLAPTCPHCSRGLLPSDFKNGCAGVSYRIEEQRRKNDPPKQSA